MTRLRLTREARAALRRTGLSRRDLLARSGALVVGFSAAHTLRGLGSLVDVHAQPRAIDAARLDAWIAIDASGRVTAYTGKCELGQGIFTAQVQLVAEELRVPIERVRLIQCDTTMTPDQGTTSGSQSHPTNFNDRNLAQAAATARAVLLQLASERLHAPIESLRAADGVIRTSTAPPATVTYGALLDGRQFEVPLSTAATRRPAREWTILGTAVPRLDMAAMVSAELEYVQHVRVPGMLHGRVVRPPSIDAALVAVDDASVRGMPGLERVVVKGNFVGVVAEKPWQALQAAARLRVSWKEGPPLPDRLASVDTWLRQQPVRDTLVVDSGDVDGTLATAPIVVSARYTHPYQAHGSMGTSCAVADVRGDGVTIWSATQSLYALRSGAAMVLGVPASSVRVIFTRGSGCYGINGADTVSYDAAVLSQATGRPVRVQLTRADEMGWENFGAAFVVDQRVGVSKDGTIVAWDYEGWSPALGGRPGYDRPGNVITGRLLGFEAAPFVPRSPAPAPTSFGNGSNAAPSYVAGRVGGSASGTGTIASERVLARSVRSRLFTGPLRSPARLQNTFAHECLMDEVAARIQADPVAFRLRHLRDPRLREVLLAAAKAANWHTRPSPAPDRPRTGIASGRGVACVLYEGDNGYCALVADVGVDLDSGRVRAARFVVAQDCGPVSNPDGMKSQIEGGALQGLSRALGEEVTWDAHRVTSVDWRSYHSLSLGFEPPVIESVLIDRDEGEAMGAGETAITIVAAAVGNAIFDATGARLRELPFTPARVLAALSAAASRQ